MGICRINIYLLIIKIKKIILFNHIKINNLYKLNTGGLCGDRTLAFSDTLLLWLVTSWFVPVIIIFGVYVWVLFRISTINKYLREIRDMLREKEKLEPKQP
jgi:hypothetical protein